MDNMNDLKNSNTNNKKYLKTFTTQIMCQALLWTQLFLGNQALAQSPEATATPLPNYDQQRAANSNHQAQAAANGGLANTCNVQSTTYDQFQTLNEEYSNFTTNSANQIRGRIEALTRRDADGNVIGGINSALIAEQSAYSATDGGFAGTSSGTPEQQQAYADAQADFAQKADTKRAARIRLDRAKRNCRPVTDRDGNTTGCPPAARTELTAAEAAFSVASSQYSVSYNQYKVARDAIQGGTLDSINDAEDPFFAKEKRYEEAQVALSQAESQKVAALAELNAAQAACDSFCTPAERQRLERARSNNSAAIGSYSAAMTEYNAARSAWRNAPRGMANDAQDATNATAGNANSMAGSHAISGCGSNFDITTNTDSDCELTGPLFEADSELTRIANQNINEARQMAASRADMLFDLELQQKFAADYKLYELAVEGGYTEEQQLAGINSLEQVDALADGSALKTKNLALTISNIKTVGAASAGVKDMVCEQHDRSEVDSKSYHIFRAATATWLMAVVNDTDYYSGAATCKSTDALSGDENNEQINSIERAANIADQRLESMCLRIEPKVPNDDARFQPGGYDPNNPEHFRVYGDTKELAARYVSVLTGYTDEDGTTHPPLRERCLEYYQKIRGSDYADKPATREYAIEMVTEALGLAMEELGAKREKIIVAHTQVMKGEQWVKRVKRDIMLMMALAAVIFAAYQAASSVCRGCSPTCGFCCSMCPVASALNSKYVYITGTVVGVWLISELMRAQSFLAKWKAKREQAKYFNHLACNFEDAQAEEDEIVEMGRIAQERKREEVQKAKNATINSINQEVYKVIRRQPIPPLENSNDQVKLWKQEIPGINNEAELITHFKERFNKADIRNIQDIKETLKNLGLELITVLVPSAQADDPPPADTRDNRRDQTRSADVLNIAQGSESFRYFLVQRNHQYQNFTNDISNQPEHTRADTEIANVSGSKPKNRDGAIIVSVHDLAAPFMGGDGSDPIASLDPLQKTGFPTPETRVATIQSLLDLFMENLTRLNGGIADVAFQRDQFVQLLNNSRTRMKIDQQGVGVTQVISNPGAKSSCLATTEDGVNVDTTCACTKEGSCLSFEYPTFAPGIPNALKAGGRLSLDTANSITSGKLGDANLNGGKLQNNAANLRKSLLESQNKVNDQRKDAGLGARDFSQESKDLTNATEQSISRGLADINSSNPNSSLSRARSSLFNTDLNAEANANKLAASQGTKSGSSSARSRGRGGRGKIGNGSDKDKVKSESFSLGDADGSNLDFDSLTDEEKRRLGLLGGRGSGANGAGNNQNDGGYRHVRRLNNDGKTGSGSSSQINGNRNRSLFGIISKRYEKTAFPVLLQLKAKK
jgi:hypothetical protein